MPANLEVYDALMRMWDVEDHKIQLLKAKLKRFRKNSEAGLRESIFSYYPELIPHKKTLIRQINLNIEGSMDTIIESCWEALCGFEVEEKRLVVFQQKKTDFVAEMAEARAEMHLYGKQAEAFVEDWRRWTNHRIAEENFTHLCQQMVKQAAYEAFPEIPRFSANALRHIEYTINLFMSEFNVGFQFFTGGYRWERFGNGGTVLPEDMREEE